MLLHTITFFSYSLAGLAVAGVASESEDKRANSGANFELSQLGGRASFSLSSPHFLQTHRRAGATSASRILIQLLVNARGLLSSDTNTLAREHLHSRAGAKRSKHYYNVILQAQSYSTRAFCLRHTMLELRAFHYNSREISSRTADSLF